MSISKKLYFGFAIGTLLTIIVGIVGIIGMQNLRISGLSMYEQQVVGIEKAGRALSAFENVRLNCRTIVIHSFYDDKREALDVKIQFESNVEEFRELMKISKELSTSDELLRFNEVIMDMFDNSYLPIAGQIIERSINDIPDHNNRLHINVMLTHINDISDWIANLVTGMMELNVAIAEQTSIENEVLTLTYIAVQTALLVVSAVFALLVALYIIRSIMKPINESADVLSKISTGNYEARIEGQYNGEFVKIKNAVNSMAVDIKARELTISGITYAGKIQRSLLPPDKVYESAFSDYSLIYRPKNIVGGDIHWIKNFDDGTLLCVSDCTGHGTPGALLTMLVVSSLRSITNENNYKDTAAIVWELEKSLLTTLNPNNAGDAKDGCDLAVLFIADDGTISVSAGNIDVFVCDGVKVTRYKGQAIHVGEGEIQNKDEIKVITIPADIRNKYYIASDGLYEQIGGDEKLPFGYETLENIVLKNHDAGQNVIIEKIMQAFESYRGEELQRDDVSLIAFQPKIKEKK
ncbi:MAG: MCP four helix bundle domain-containing protein [Oscillospiraceae bacterium]|nr:MCP four helix bundle domain-containing protein [Oscillospiraceae bacterium]